MRAHAISVQTSFSLLSPFSSFTRKPASADRRFIDIYLDEGDGEVMKKSPLHWSYIHQRRSREHYYIMTKTSVEYTKFQPDKHEILVSKYSLLHFISTISFVHRMSNGIVFAGFHVVTVVQVRPKHREINGLRTTY